MKWIYVSDILDEVYSSELPPKRALSKDALPEEEFTLRKELADWQMSAFVPASSLSWFDKILDRNEYETAKEHLNKADLSIENLVSEPHYFAALKRILSVMPEHLPQKKYLIQRFL